MQQVPYGTFEFELARRWAPFHWQEVGPSGWQGDLLTAVNFDGDWKTIGNWDAMDQYPLIPFVYYSVVESATHWFLLYAFYHPRDWATGIGQAVDQHENDMEGLLLVVEKPGSLAGAFEHGQILGMITLAHNHFYSYSNVLEGNQESLDGPLFLGPNAGVLRPCTRQEAKGHGCYGLQPTDSRAWQDLGQPLQIDDGIARRAFEFRDESGIRYFPGHEAEAPAGYGPVTERDEPYVLEDIFAPGGFWQRKCGPLNEPFTEGWKRLAGRKHGEDKASPPWSWDDKDDGPSLGAGLIATDPARLAYYYFKGFGSFSLDYLHNPYTLPLACPDGTPAAALTLRAGSAAGPRPRSRRPSEAALRRKLRLALDPGARQEVSNALLQEAERSGRFRRDLAAAAHSTVTAAISPGRRRTVAPDPAERLHLAIPAIRALGRLEDRESRPLLVELLGASTDRDVLLAALESLSQLSPGNVRGLKKALVDLLTYGDPQVRAAAARLYARVMARRDPDPLAALVADPSSEVRAAALEGLGRSGRRKYRRDLERAVDDPDEKAYVRVAAARALLGDRSGQSRARYARARGFERGLGLREPAPGGARPRPQALTETPLSADEYGDFCLARELEA